jgi:AcrR family transcriptional regulator
MARPKVENHKTAEVILESAKQIFLEKGFDGASINDVADTAKINKSLIYHHFGNKENLWKAVKERIVNQALPKETVTFKHPTLREFIEAFVAFRFHLYATHPELIRLMGWQRLDSKIDALAGINIEPFVGLEDHLRNLQATGQIRADLEPSVILYLIMSLSSNAFVDNAPFLKTKTGRKQYLKVIVEGLMKILSASVIQ